MTQNDISAYTFPETGWIWTKLGRGMGWEKVAYKIFAKIAREAGEGQNTSLFRDECYAAVGHFSFTDLCKIWQKYVNRPHESFCSEILIFSVKRSLFPKKTLFGCYWLPSMSGLQCRGFVF